MTRKFDRITISVKHLNDDTRLGGKQYVTRIFEHQDPQKPRKTVEKSDFLCTADNSAVRKLQQNLW